MATQSKAETVTLRLESNIDSAADAAMGALGRLERQIGREENALGRLERSLVEANAKLVALSAGSVDKRAVAAFERQAAAVDAMRGKLDSARATLAQLSATDGDPKAIKSAIKKIEQLEASLVSASSKLSKLEAPAKTVSVDPAAVQKQQGAVEVLTDRIAAQRDKIEGLRDKSNQARSASQQLGDAAKYLGEKSGLAGTEAAVLGKQIAALGPYGAIAAAAILATVGAVAAFVSIIAKGINSAGQMRAEFLKLQVSSVSSSMGMHWLFNATRESADGAARLQKSINAVNATSSLGRAKLAEYAAEINSVRFRGKDADKVLRAMSIAGSAGSDSMAKEVLQMARAYRFAGGSIDDLTKRVEQKLGRAAMSQAIAFDAQMSRLRENITWIFGGADIDPLLRAMNTILSLFNAGSDSANTMRDMVTKLVEWAIGGMLRMGIAILKAYIALRENESAWKTVIAVTKVAVIGFTVMMAAATILSFALLMIPVAIAAAVGGFAWLMGKLAEVANTAKSSAVRIGANIIGGILSGIVPGGPAVWAALKTVISGAVANTEAQLKIKSPSRVFAGIGHQVTAGMAVGITANESAVLGATESLTANMVESSAGMVANDSGRPAVSTVSTHNSSSESKQVIFQNCNFGSNSQADIEQAVYIALEKGSLSGRAA